MRPPNGTTLKISCAGSANKHLTFPEILVDFFFVMRDNVTCEEVFELHADSWVADVTVPNGFDDVEAEADDRCWCKFFESCAECA